jgi:hypothetical protein
MTTGPAGGFASTGIENHPGHSSQKSHGRKGAGSGDLETRVKAGVDESKTVELSGGQNAKTELVTLADGSVAVRKTFKEVEGRSGKEQADAEELGSATTRAFGVNAPDVYRAGAETVYMEHMDGRVAAALPREPGKFSVEGDHYESDPGRVMGLADATIDNYDRNAGNWLVGSDGGIQAIDHGSAFSFYGRFGQPSVAPFGNPGDRQFYGRLSKPFPNMGEWADNDYSPQDMATAKRRLRELRPHYDRLGRGDWHDKAMDRLTFISEHAKGTRVRIKDPS